MRKNFSEVRHQHNLIVRNKDAKLVLLVLLKAVPPMLLDMIGIAEVIFRVPAAYLKAFVAAWIASNFIYSQETIGGAGRELAFMNFMRKLEIEAEAVFSDAPSTPTKLFGETTPM